MRSPIPKERKTYIYDWAPTNSCLSVATHTEAGSRARAMDLLSSNKIFWIRVKDDRVDAIVRGGEEDYIVSLDFTDNSFGSFMSGSMQCECESFLYREGPCKHLCAIAVEAVVRREGGDARDWVSTACSEARNSGQQYKPWEDKPSVTESEAMFHGVDVEVYRKHRKDVRCYIMDDGMRWSGSLPLPNVGDRVITKLATGDEVEAEIIEKFKDDKMGMLGYWVELEDRPEAYKNSRIVVYGSEILSRRM